MVDLWLPKNRVTPYIEIEPEEEGDMPVILLDMGTLNGHQEEEILAKVREDRERDRKVRRRLRPPRHVAITTLVDRDTHQITGYRVEVKEV